MTRFSIFLNGCFSVMGGPMDMIFGVFWETTVRFLKSIISQFFSIYSKSYNIFNAKSRFKTQGLLTKRRAVLGSSNYMSPIEHYKSFLKWPWWSLAFEVFEILRSPVSMQKSNMTSTLFLMNFQNMVLTLCQTQYSRLQKMLLVSHKMTFLENEAA